MIMPEAHRENHHRADTAQRKTCQTDQKPDMYNNSFPGSEICESGPREFLALSGPLVAPPFIGVSGGCATKRKLERKQTCVWRFPN